MKILLRSRRTGLYYGGDDRWVPLEGCAMQFQGIGEAVQTCCAQRLEDTEVVLHYERPECELRVGLAAAAGVF